MTSYFQDGGHDVISGCQLPMLLLMQHVHCKRSSVDSRDQAADKRWASVAS